MCCFVLPVVVLQQSIDLHSAEISKLKNREKELLHKVYNFFSSEEMLSL